MEAEFDLPLGEFPHDPPAQIPEDIDSNWTPLKKALETYTRIVLHCTRLWIIREEEDVEEWLEEFWEASKYDVGDPPDRTKILIKSPLELPLSETEIEEVIRTTRKLLSVDPPEEWLDLLRITNGVRAAGTYDLEVTSRIQREPFSSWDYVEMDMEGQEQLPKTETGIPEEIYNVFRWSSLARQNFNLICGFQCGLIFNSYDSGLWYLLVEPGDPEINSESRNSGRCWKLVGSAVPRDGIEQFDSIEHTLRSWANMFLQWV
jgi:hypothetical protein